MSNFENNPYPARNSVEQTKTTEQKPEQDNSKQEDVAQNSSTTEAPKTAENSIEKGDFIPHYLLESAE